MTPSTKPAAPPQHEWVIPTLWITLALTLAIGIGFLAGQLAPARPDAMAAICSNLPKEGLTANCIALRSTVATEGATQVARWGIWISVGSLVASGGALIGLIFAFLQGQRGIALAIEANAIAADIGKAQARAFVVVHRVECKLNAAGQIVTKATFHNSGQSPARRLRWLYNAALVTIHDDEQHCFVLGDEPDLERSHWRHDVPAAASFTSLPLAVGVRQDSQIAEALEKALMIPLTVKIVADYEDVFGEKHQEVACFQGSVSLSGSVGVYTDLDHAPDDSFRKTVQKTGASCR